MSDRLGEGTLQGAGNVPYLVVCLAVCRCEMGQLQGNSGIWPVLQLCQMNHLSLGFGYVLKVLSLISVSE